VTDLDILNRDVHLLILSLIYILTHTKKKLLYIFSFEARGVPTSQVDPPMKVGSGRINISGLMS